MHPYKWRVFCTLANCNHNVKATFIFTTYKDFIPYVGLDLRFSTLDCDLKIKGNIQFREDEHDWLMDGEICMPYPYEAGYHFGFVDSLLTKDCRFELVNRMAYEKQKAEWVRAGKPKPKRGAPE